MSLTELVLIIFISLGILDKKKLNLRKFLDNKLFRSFILFSIFRAIYGLFIVIFAYYFSREYELNYFQTGLIFLFSVFISRIGFKYFKTKFSL